MNPPVIKPPRLKRKRVHRPRKIIAAPSASVKRPNVTPAVALLPPPLTSTADGDDDASCTALSIPEKSANLASFCTTYRPPPRAAVVTLPPELPPAAAAPADNTTPAADATGRNDNEEEDDSSNAGPVVTIVDGEIVLQAASRTPRSQLMTTHRTTVVEDETESAIIHASYSSFLPHQRDRNGWTVEETKFFYQALRQVGLDFGTMETVFADAANASGDSVIRKRTRVQLKNKHRRENNQRPDLVYQAVWGNRPQRDMSTMALVVSDPRKEKETEELAISTEDAENDEGASNERTVRFAEDATGNEEQAKDPEANHQEDTNNPEEEDPFESEPVDEEEYWGL